MLTALRARTDVCCSKAAAKVSFVIEPPHWVRGDRARFSGSVEKQCAQGRENNLRLHISDTDEVMLAIVFGKTAEAKYIPGYSVWLQGRNDPISTN